MGDRWILAVDLGNGGPKVAASRCEGELLRTALRPVSVHIGLDGTATQDAAEWWVQLLEAVREVDRRVAASTATRCTPSRSPASGPRPCRSAPTASPSGPVLLWADTRARPLRATRSSAAR